MKISIVASLLVCSLFLVASCGVKGPLYHGKDDSVPKIEKTKKAEPVEADKTDEEKK